VKSARLAAVVLCLLPLLVIPAGAAGTGTAADAAAAAAMRRTLMYGIDSQVMEALQTLKKAWDPGFAGDLAAILTDKRSASLQTAVLEVFRDQSLSDGEGFARLILDNWQDEPSDLGIAAIRYLGALHSGGLAARLTPIVDSTDKGLATAAIEGLGMAGDSSSAALLLKKLASTDYPDGRKTDLILALGTLKDKSAVDALLGIVQNTDEERIRRLYAADALGKIGDPRALPALRDMLGEKEALVRQYAAGALARFSLAEVFDSLIQGLRDEDAKVRESSAKALGRPLDGAQSPAAVPILSYKAELDPVSQVRIASIKALGEIGGDPAMQRLLAIYRASDRPLESREAALMILASKALPLSMGAIRKVIDDEWKANDPRTLESTAKVLSAARGAELRDLYVRFMGSPDPVVRSYGARGAAFNGFSDLKDKVKAMGDTDPNPGTRKEAQLAAAKL